MNESTISITVDYYTDILCVWAWIAQPRLEELQKHWKNKVCVKHRFVDIFGDSYRKIPAAWGERDGFEKFQAHVQHAAEKFEEARIHHAIWTRTRPRSSMQAHLLLRAVEIVAGPTQLEKLALRIRRAFFCDALDVSDMDLLLELAQEASVDANSLRESLYSGEAMADLSRDLRAAQESGVRGSPTWVLNEGRQVLYGNVGNRILNVNIEELRNNPAEETSCC